MQLERLPKVQSLGFSFRAQGDMRVSPLPTTAIHGALGHVLAELACPSASVFSCQHDGADACLYRRLFSPPKCEEGTPPPTLVLAPQVPYRRDEAQFFAKGESLDLRICLIGKEAIESQGLIVAALRRVAERGIGITPTGHKRVGMELVDLRVLSSDIGTPSAEVVLDFITPARFIKAGNTQHVLDPDILWSGISRRAETLSRWYGDGPLFNDTPGALVKMPAPFAIRGSYTRSVRVRRYSSRQNKRMEWQALMGVTTVHDKQLQRIWPLLQFASEVQIGKSTSFGFGRFHLTPVTMECEGKRN